MANILKNLEKIEICGDFAIFYYKNVTVTVDFEAEIETETHYTPTPDWGGFNTVEATADVYILKAELNSEINNKSYAVEIRDLNILKEYKEVLQEELKQLAERA